MSKDITPILEGWDYESEKISVRKVRGVDGRPRIQLRLDLGLIQMEMSGRPDGRRPRGMESLLEHHLARLQRHRERHDSEQGFRLTPEECADLRHEGTIYYYRYFSLFHLGEYKGVERDTARNLRLFDLLRDHAAQESDRYSLEQYRPYVLMMNTRARATLLRAQEDFAGALRAIEEGVQKIEEFYQAYGREDLIGTCGYLEGLRELAEELRREKPLTPEDALRRELQDAVAREDYERAARLRDVIRRLGEK